jgi:hypothetical protein
MARNEKQRTILKLIEDSPSGIASWGLHLRTEYPLPSIRRIIGELRRQGWKIEHRKVNGYYYPRYIMVR